MIVTIDVGGTKTLVAVFSDDGKLEKQLKFPTPPEYENFVSELGSQINQLNLTSIDKTVIAIPGMVDRSNGIGHAFGNLTWKDVPIEDDVTKITSSEVIVENDANLAGLSEADLLKGQFRKVLYVTISTGIGGVLIVDNAMDPDTLDAEIGHGLFEYDGKMQQWEDFASGRAIVEKYGKRASEIDDPKIWHDIAHNIALGLYNTIATLTPEVVVIGGGVGAHLDKFKDVLEAALAEYPDPQVIIPPILQAKRAEEAVIYGAYLLAKQS